MLPLQTPVHPARHQRAAKDKKSTQFTSKPKLGYVATHRSQCAINFLAACGPDLEIYTTSWSDQRKTIMLEKQLFRTRTRCAKQHGTQAMVSKLAAAVLKQRWSRRQRGSPSILSNIHIKLKQQHGLTVCEHRRCKIQMI